MSVTEKKMGNVNPAAWMAELVKLNQKQRIEGFSAAELMQAADVRISTVGQLIRKGIAAGLIEFAGKRVSVTVTGDRCMTPVYREVKKRK